MERIRSQYPLILIDISYFLEYGYEKTVLFLLNIYNNNLFKQNIRFVQSIYSEHQKIKNIKEDEIFNKLSEILKKHIKHISFIENEENTIGNIFFKKFIINWDFLKNYIEKYKHKENIENKIEKLNFNRLKNLIKIGNQKLTFLIKYIKFINSEEKRIFYDKKNNNKKIDHESENIKDLTSNLTIFDIPFILEKIGSFESSLDSLRLCPLFYDSLDNLITNYTNLTIPYILKFNKEKNKEKINFLENFLWFDKLFYQIFRVNLYLKHEYYDFKIEDIINELLELKNELCCIINSSLMNLNDEFFRIKRPEIKNKRFDLRFNEYKKYYLQDIKLEDSFLDEAKIDITLLESETEDNNTFDYDTSFNKSIEYIEVKQEEEFIYSFKPNKSYFSNTTLLKLPFCLCGYLYNLTLALKYKLQYKIEINLKCLNQFKILRSTFFIKWICDIIKDSNDWIKLQILFGDLCLLRDELNLKEHLCKKVKESIFENNQNILNEGEEDLIEIIEGRNPKNWYINTQILYTSFINKIMTLSFIYESLPKKKKLKFKKSNILKLVEEIIYSINCLYKLSKFGEQPCDILIAAIECFYFFNSTDYTILLKKLEKNLINNIKKLLSFKRKGSLLIEHISNKNKIKDFKFFFIIYQIFGDDQLIELIQNLRIEHDQLIRTQIEHNNLNEVKTLSLRNRLTINYNQLMSSKIKGGYIGSFSKILYELPNAENIKCIDQILNYNKNEILLIEKVKLLLKLGYEKEALEKLKYCKSYRATNLVNKIRAEGEHFSLKKQKLNFHTNFETEHCKVLQPETIMVLGERYDEEDE